MAPKIPPTDKFSSRTPNLWMQRKPCLKAKKITTIIEEATPARCKANPKCLWIRANPSPQFFPTKDFRRCSSRILKIPYNLSKLQVLPHLNFSASSNRVNFRRGAWIKTSSPRVNFRPNLQAWVVETTTSSSSTCKLLLLLLVLPLLKETIPRDVSRLLREQITRQVADISNRSIIREFKTRPNLPCKDVKPRKLPRRWP